MTPLLRFPLALALAALTGLANAQNYQYETFVNLEYDGSGIVSEEGNPGGVAEAFFELPGMGTSRGRASGGPGVSRASLEFHGTNASNPVGHADGESLSRYFDSFTIDDPTRNGTMGTFTTTLFVRGSGDFRLDPAIASNELAYVDAWWEAAINVSADGIVDENGIPYDQTALYGGGWTKEAGATTVSYSGDALGVYQREVQFQFVYGEEIFLDNDLQTGLFYENQDFIGGTFDFNLDLGHSAYWGGLTSVRDASGNLVTGYGYSSASGFDYRVSAAPVPEPASLAMLGVGAAALLRRRKRA